MNTSQDWWFTTEQSVLTIDTLSSRVGINNPSPQYDLHIINTTATSNLLAPFVWSSNIVNSGIVQTNDLLSTATVQTSNLVTTGVISSSNIANTGQIDTQLATFSTGIASNFSACNVEFDQHLVYRGAPLYDTCPFDANAWQSLIPFTEDVGYIHHSWIRTPITAAGIFEDLWELGNLGLSIASLMLALKNFVDPPTAQDLFTDLQKEALRQLLDSADNPGENDLQVSWSNLIRKPIANNGLSIGVRGDLFVADAQSLKVVSASQFTNANFNNNLEFSTNSADTILNFGTKECFLNKLNVGTNVVISENSNSFRLHNWYFNSNTMYNAVNSNNTVTFAESDLSFASSVSVASNVTCDRYSSFSNGSMHFTGSNLRIGFVNGVSDQSFVDVKSNGIVFGFQESNLVEPRVAFSVDGGGSGYLASNLTMSNVVVVSSASNDNSQVSGGRLAFDAHGMMYSSYSNDGFFDYNTLHFGVDSNGSAFVRSNIVFPNTAVIVGQSNDFVNTTVSEGRLHVEPNVMRYYKYSSNATSESSNVQFSVNSNGMFLLTKPRVYGATETIPIQNPLDPLGPDIDWTNYPRFEMSLSNGLKYGYGLEKSLNDLDLLNVTRKAQILTLDHRDLGMKPVVNSNAQLCGEIRTGAFRVATDGTVTIGKLQILPSGKVMYDNDVLVSFQGRIPQNRIAFDGAGEFITYNQKPLDIPSQVYQKGLFDY
jgi:hypothetical protein